MTTEQYAERTEAIEHYTQWVNNACRRAENGEVDRPEPMTTTFLDRQREREFRQL